MNLETCESTLPYARGSPSPLAIEPVHRPSRHPITTGRSAGATRNLATRTRPPSTAITPSRRANFSGPPSDPPILGSTSGNCFHCLQDPRACPQSPKQGVALTFITRKAANKKRVMQMKNSIARAS